MRSLRPPRAAYHPHVIALLIAGGLVATACCTDATAQQPTRDARKQFVEGLLKSLIESQIDRRPPPPNRPPLPRLEQVLLVARKNLDSFSTHSAQLVNDWSANVARSPNSRHMLGDLIKLNATVANVQTRAANARHVEDLRADIVVLDREWRLLSHRLKQTENLSPECSRCIGRLNELDTVLCTAFGVSPQVDFHSLVAATLALNTSLSHLIEDIELELPRTRIGRSLIAEAAQVQQRSLLLSNLVSQRRKYEEVVNSFRGFYSQWSSVASKIRQVDSRHLERNVRRIDESSHAIHELLWLPEDVDYGRLSYLTRSLRRDVDGMFNTVSLNVLLELSQAARVLPVASEFYGLCENFTNSVESRAPLRQLQSDYRYLVDSWPELSGCFSPCRTPEVVQSLKGIEESFVSLRDAIGLAPQVDWKHGNEVAAALIVSSDSVIAEVQRHVYSNPRYDQRFRFESARDASAFRGAVRRLHEAIVNRQEELLRERTETMADAWAHLIEHCFRQLLPADQLHLRDLRSLATEHVVEIQAMLLP
ncbi:MAG: hypothetical protein H8E66_23455 [Planctomycetes bacterium]|nr:hypothetical protein [Planctomycetota bacterium]